MMNTASVKLRVYIRRAFYTNKGGYCNGTMSKGLDIFRVEEENGGVINNIATYRSQNLQNGDREVMPSKEFSSDDVVIICTSIASADNLIVQATNKKGIFRRSSDTDQTGNAQRKSSIARKLSLVNGIPCENGGREIFIDSPRINGGVKSKNYEKENIPGLKGRDIVAVAILVDENGAPTKTYTEHDDIPGEEIEKAGQIFLSRIPMPVEKEKLRKSLSSETDNTKFLSEVLSDLDEIKKSKLMKKLDKTLSKLHTCDLNTALSFLKTERYREVRKEIKDEMLLFATNTLKMNRVHVDFV